MAKTKSFPDSSSNYQVTIAGPCTDKGGHIESYACVIPPPPPPAPAQPAYAAPAYTAPPDDGSAKLFIYMHESGNNPGAVNASSGACGLGQALPCSKMGCSLSDYACQDNFFTLYMLGRYGSWENARAFWLGHSWW